MRVPTPGAARAGCPAMWPIALFGADSLRVFVLFAVPLAAAPVGSAGPGLRRRPVHATGILAAGGAVGDVSIPAVAIGVFCTVAVLSTPRGLVATGGPTRRGAPSAS